MRATGMRTVYDLLFSREESVIVARLRLCSPRRRDGPPLARSARTSICRSVSRAHSSPLCLGCFFRNTPTLAALCLSRASRSSRASSSFSSSSSELSSVSGLSTRRLCAEN